MTSAPTGSLQDKVIVILGAGPGTGKTLGVMAARQGATVVLSARTAERLDQLAGDVRAEVPGAEVLAVPADAADPDSIRALRERVEQTYGRADGLVFAAFGVPSMRPLARTDHEQIRAGIDLSVFGALTFVQEFTDLLEASAGSVVLVASAVIHHSRERYAGYKVAKTAMISIGHSLATELGPKGIRINSVAPGYIYGDTLKAYFAALAEKYGSSEEDVYAFTADKIDLRRLPTEDEIAAPICFLLSGAASGVTGQTLTVDCGEFHS